MRRDAYNFTTVLVYVDDIIVVGKNNYFIRELKEVMKKNSKVKI